MPMGYYEQKINYKWPYNATVIFILFNDIFYSSVVLIRIVSVSLDDWWCTWCVFYNTDIVKVKACVCYFSLALKDKCISFLIRTKYIEKKFTLLLFFLPTVSQTFILSRVMMRYPPPWNFLFRKNNCMCNRDNACDVATCPDA